MADADEDVIPRSTPSTNAHDPDYDPEDEAQDLRFLASLSGTNASIPKRGEKDFEPNPTKAQQNVLNASREAMHNALAVERVHVAKTACIGVYIPNPEEWMYDPATDRVGPGARCVVVERFKGGHNKSLGKEDFRNWTWLLPEEALLLLERGSLDIRWPEPGAEDVIVRTLAEEDERTVGDEQNRSVITHEQDQGNIAHDDTSNLKSEALPATREKEIYTLRSSDIPMSLQAAYAFLLGKSGLTSERYTVYAGLRRLGYVVQRAPTWDESEQKDPAGDEPLPQSQLVTEHNEKATSLAQRLMSWLFNSNGLAQYNLAQGPLIKPGVYRNYNDIFKALSLIPTVQPGPTHDLKPRSPFKVDFTIMKPASLSTYRKSTPPAQPDFLISVVDARTTSIPTLVQIGALLDSIPEDLLPKERKMEVRLKHGRRNVLLAVVDCGIVSYLRVADMGFSEQGRVHEEKTRRGTKGSRGRGGGRGGRGGRGGGARGRGA